MPLSPDAKLGPYEVLAPLGAGGMGEVYRARDTRLDRTVAIKVLPDHLASNADLRARFEREAKAVSSLNHPHICTVHDVGQQDGIDYIVMELVEGDTLLQRLKKGPLPVELTLRYGIEIADALDKAHRHGVVHRDLKPGNVMLTKAGSKLLDFGLAKRGPAGDDHGGTSTLETREKPLTEAGSLLGTYQYMSPEQLEGKEADARADIWALGCVLYEMATGKRAFEGKSQASLLSAIMTSEPQPIAQLQPMMPPALDRLVNVCLAKDPDDRLQAAHDVMQELKWISEAGVPMTATGRRAARAPSRIAWGVACVLAIVLAAVLLARGRAPAFERRLLRLPIAPPPKVTVSEYLTLSPDGRRLAFLATDAGGKTMIWVQALEAAAAAPVAGTEDGKLPFWSPDSREVAFFAGNKLKRVDVSGSSPQTICEAADGRGGSWSAAGLILYTPDCCSGLFGVPASGGAPRPVTSTDTTRGELSHRWPLFLPDGKHFLYTVTTADFGQNDVSGLYIGALDSPRGKRLTGAQSIAGFEPPDRVVYVKEGRLVKSRLDLVRQALSTETVPVAEDVRMDVQLAGQVSFTTSGAGLIAYRGGGRPSTRLTWFDRSGRPLGVIGEPREQQWVALSPDDRQVAVSAVDPGRWSSSLWLVDTRDGQSSRLTFEDLSAVAPIWSADASRVLFNGAVLRELNGIYQKSLAGGGQELLYRGPRQLYVDDWSADGHYVLYEVIDPKTSSDLWLLSLFGDRKPHLILATPAFETHAKLSPDGRWIAYASDALGRAEVFVQPFPTGLGRWQVSIAGGDEPIWRRDSKELFYLSLDRKIMALAVGGDGGRFEATPARALFSAPVLPPLITGNAGHYAVSADGQRILVNALTEEAPSPITLLVEWASQKK